MPYTGTFHGPRSRPTWLRFHPRIRGLHDLDFEDEIASTRGNFVNSVLSIFEVKNRRNAQERCFWGKRGKNGSKTTHR